MYLILTETNWTNRLMGAQACRLLENPPLSSIMHTHNFVRGSFLEAFLMLTHNLVRCCSWKLSFALPRFLRAKLIQGGWLSCGIEQQVETSQELAPRRLLTAPAPRTIRGSSVQLVANPQEAVPGSRFDAPRKAKCPERKSTTMFP